MLNNFHLEGILAEIPTSLAETIILAEILAETIILAEILAETIILAEILAETIILAGILAGILAETIILAEITLRDSSSKRSESVSFDDDLSRFK
jgi:hypothetical protein